MDLDVQFMKVTPTKSAVDGDEGDRDADGNTTAHRTFGNSKLLIDPICFWLGWCPATVAKGYGSP